MRTQAARKEVDIHGIKMLFQSGEVMRSERMWLHRLGSVLSSSTVTFFSVKWFVRSNRLQLLDELQSHMVDKNP